MADAWNDRETPDVAWLVSESLNMQGWHNGEPAFSTVPNLDGEVGHGFMLYEDGAQAGWQVVVYREQT